MNINRHNYEEFFILYMDNELGLAERRQVEAFVQNHPDLKEELDSLLHYKLVPETDIVFSNKEELLKGENASAINMANYEDWLMLYIDMELPQADRTMVETFVAANPIAMAALEGFQKAKVQPESLQFAFKETLYRTERKIPVLWWRMAAAALILALGLSAVFIFRGSRSKADKEVATVPGQRETLLPVKKQPELIAKKTDEPAIVKKDQPIVIPSPVENKTALNKAASRQENESPTIADNNKVVISPKNILPVKDEKPLKKDEMVVTTNDNKPTNNLPLPNKTNPFNNAVKDLAVNPVKDESIQQDKALTKPVVTTAAADPSDIKTAAYKPTDEGFEQDGKDGKKNKLRGFFRKVTRTFEKRTNIDATNDNKLLVGGLSFNLK